MTELVALVNAQDADGLRDHLNNPAHPDDARRHIDAAQGRQWVAGTILVEQLTNWVYKVVLPLSSGEIRTEWQLGVVWEDGRFSASPLS